MNDMKRVIAAIIAALFHVTSDACGVSPCSAGCYLDLSKNSCVRVPFGHYSPAADDAMYECPAGTYSGVGAVNCTACDLGSFTPYAGSGYCPLCNPGEYASEYGSSSCSKCNYKYYFGPGSKAMYFDGTHRFCLQLRSDLSKYPSMAQSAVPNMSVVPLRAPTNIPSGAPSDGSATIVLTGAPTTAPTIVPQIPSAQPSMLIMPTAQTRIPLVSLTAAPTRNITTEAPMMATSKTQHPSVGLTAAPTGKSTTEALSVTTKDTTPTILPTGFVFNRQHDATLSTTPTSSPSSNKTIPSLGEKPSVDQKQGLERNRAFRRYFPLLGALILISLVTALLIKRARGTKMRRRQRTAPTTPPRGTSKTIVTRREEESVADLYLSDSVVEDGSVMYDFYSDNSI